MFQISISPVGSGDEAAPQSTLPDHHSLFAHLHHLCASSDWAKLFSLALSMHVKLGPMFVLSPQCHPNPMTVGACGGGGGSLHLTPPPSPRFESPHLKCNRAHLSNQGWIGRRGLASVAEVPLLAYPRFVPRICPLLWLHPRQAQELQREVHRAPVAAEPYRLTIPTNYLM